MTPKRFVYRAWIRILECCMMMHAYKHCFSYKLPLVALPRNAEKSPCVDVVTVAYNNDFVIAQQIRLVTKYFDEGMHYIVADNSSVAEKSEAIRTLCLDHNVSYVRLPKNRLGLISPSYSHAAALNWVYRKIIRKRRPEYFGFIDHDLFPVAPITITRLFALSPVYGYLRESGPYWYLWPGLCFFCYGYVSHHHVDFMPVKMGGHYLDTGGGNWRGIYASLIKDASNEVQVEQVKLREGSNYYGDGIQYFDQRLWLHTINGSYWQNVPNKDDLIASILDKY